jgi:hypothetical protein
VHRDSKQRMLERGDVMGWGRREESEPDRKLTLTPIDETVVILRVRLGTVALPRENDGGNAFGAPRGVVRDGDFTQGSNHGLKEFLINYIV